ncbi:MAG: hypothetical protein DRQ55_00625 [Planctomycetota bacterium]|nr:MAG: hypothetical protein DRQ55_00625 [Planctomycetota bacterium]
MNAAAPSTEARALRALRPATRAATLLACLLGTLASCDTESSTPTAAAMRQPDVLLICLDTVRADHLGCSGYSEHNTTPTLDALAAQGLMFRQAVASSGWTKPSVPSFLTGTHPAIHGVYEGSTRRQGVLTTDVLGPEAHTLAEAFSEAGYATAAFVRNAQLRTGLGFEQGFDVYVDRAGDAADIRAAALAWLDQREGDRPWFLYLHILDAHWPYDVPDEAALRFTDEKTLALVRHDEWRATHDAINDGELKLSETELGQLTDLYDGALRYVDDQLGLLFAALQQRTPERRPIVAVVSDHGEEFLEHGRLGHGHALWQNLTHAVFLLSGPGIPHAEIEQPVRLTDVYATLLSAAGLTAGQAAQRWSTDRLRHPRRQTELFSEHKGDDVYLQALRVGDLKLVRSFRPPPGARESAGVARLRRGGRWEAELEPGLSPRRARALKLRDEDEDDPTELKGFLLATDGGMSLAGVPVRWSADVRLGGSLAVLADLGPGRALKLRGELMDGVFAVQSAKGYAQAERIDVELRGALSRLVVDESGGGTAWIGGIPVLFDARTQFKQLPAQHADPLLSRSEVAKLLELGGDGAVSEGYRVMSRLFDLAQDPGESAPVLEVLGASTHGQAEQGELAELARRLDALGRELTTHNAWSTQEGSALSGDDVAALRALGYVR